MSDKTEKRMADSYEITTAIRIGGKEVVLGIDDAKDQPYLCALYSANELFGEYAESVVSDDYAEIIKLFGQRVQEQADRVTAERGTVAVPLTRMTAQDCFANDYAQSIEGKVVAIKANSLSPEYRSAVHQLVLVTGGNGAHANARGTACFCIDLYSGKHTRWERFDVQGEIKPERLPDWAKRRLAKISETEKAKKSNKPTR